MNNDWDVVKWEVETQNKNDLFRAVLTVKTSGEDPVISQWPGEWKSKEEAYREANDTLETFTKILSTMTDEQQWAFWEDFFERRVNEAKIESMF